LKAQLIDLGRHKFNGEVNFNTWTGLLREIRKHLLSRDISIEAEDGSNTGQIIVGLSDRPVGRIRLIDGVFKVLKESTLTVVPDERR